MAGFACVLALLVACGGDDTGATAGAGAGGPEPITIGVNVALTGNLGPFGQAEQASTKVTENLINSFGGVAGRRVAFDIVDDATDSAVSTTVMQGFIGKKLTAVLGPTGSGQAAVLQPIASEAKLLLISPSASTPVTREAEPAKDRYFFRTAASHALQAKAIAIRVARGFEGGDGSGGGGGGGGVPGCKKVAVIHADDAYGNPIAEGFAAQMMVEGGSVAIDIKVPATAQASYDVEAQKVIDADPDCQVIISFPDVGVGYMRSFKKVTLGLPQYASFLSVGSNGLFSAAFLTLGLEDPTDPTSPTIGEGMYLINLDLAPDTTQYKEFANIFTIHFPLEEGKTELAGYTANQFDAIALLCLAIERAGGIEDPKKIRDALYEVSRPPGTAFSPAHLGEALYAIRLGQDIDYDGASGPVDFDDYGEVLSSYVVYKVASGAFAKIPGDTIKVEDLE